MGFFSTLFGKKDTEPRQTQVAKPAEDTEPRQTKETKPVEKAPVCDAPLLDLTRLLTSQLVALWLDRGQPEYRAEYLRRMKLCGLTDQAANGMLDYEAGILKAHPRPEMLREDFISLPLFTLSVPVLEHPVTYYATHFEYPFSYIVKLSDEAEWHFWNSHERNLPGDVWAEIFDLADRNQRLFLPFATDLLSRGWTVAMVNTFSYHEQGMLNQYRWGKKGSRAAQTPWQA